MAAVMTLGASAPIEREKTGPTVGRLTAVFALVLSLFAVAATPAAQVVPDQVSAAVSAVVPDFVEEAFGADTADAWNPWKAVRNTVIGAAAGFASGCAVGAIAGMVVASAPGCVAVGTATGVSGAIGGFWSSFQNW